MSKIKMKPLWKDVLICPGGFKTKLLKFFDYYIAAFFCIAFKPKSNPEIKFSKVGISKILIIRPGGIGDAVLIFPLIKEIRRLFEGVELDVLAEKRNAEVFLILNNLVDEVFCYDSFKLFTVWARLREKDYDIVFDTEQWHNLTAIFSYFVGSRTRIGFNTRPLRSRFYTNLSPYDEERYEAENFINLLYTLLPNEVVRELKVPFFSLTPEIAAWAKTFIGENEKAIALCLSASIEQRSWSADNFRKLSEYLRQRKYKILFLGAKREKKIASLILKGDYQCTDILDFVGKTNILQTAALIKLSKLYIGLDSGILHLAYALGVPTISLFGPGRRNKWAPRHPMHITICKDLPCSPCTSFSYTSACNRPRCMEAITVQDVIAAIEKQEGTKYLQM